jgi:aspartyl-tRNA synthetase
LAREREREMVRLLVCLFVSCLLIKYSNAVGKLCFLLLRQKTASIQGVVESSNQIPKEMIKFAAAYVNFSKNLKGPYKNLNSSKIKFCRIPRESVVDVEGIVKKSVTTIESATQQSLEVPLQSIQSFSFILFLQY